MKKTCGNHKCRKKEDCTWYVPELIDRAGFTKTYDSDYSTFKCEYFTLDLRHREAVF
jgi:hypothetical protein